VPSNEADNLIQRCRLAGIIDAVIIGKITAGKRIVVK
jgi:hypothetical protein